MAFTPPVETFCARRFGVDSKGLPLSKKPDGDVSDLEWIRPGTAEDRQKIVARSRRPTSVPSLQYDSCPSHEVVGGFFSEFEAIRTPRCSAQAQQEGISLLEAEKAIEEENKSRPATSEGAIVTVEEEFEVRAASSTGP